MAFFDALGAPFFVKADSFINNKISLSGASKKLFSFNEKKYNSSLGGFISQSSWQSILNSEGIFGYRLNNASINYSSCLLYTSPSPRDDT